MPILPAAAGNSIRIKKLIEGIGDNNCKIDYAHIEMDTGDKEAMQKFLATYNGTLYSLEYVPDQSVVSKIRHILRRLLDITNIIHIPYKIDEFCDKSVCEKVESIANTRKYDFIVVEYVFLSRIFNYIKSDAIKVLDTHDLFANRHKEFVKRGFKYKWFYTTKKHEKLGFERADTVIAIQENENKIISEMIEDETEIVTIGYKTKPYDSDYVFNNTISFIASSNTFNVIGLMWFLDNVFPRILDLNKETRLIIAGGITKIIKESKYSSSKNIDFYGRFEKPEDIYNISSIIINPMTIGTGLKIKTIEALAYGKPVVATTTGGDGIKNAGNKYFFITDSPDEFAEHINSLTKDEALYKKYIDNACLFIENYNNDVDASIKKLLEKREV